MYIQYYTYILSLRERLHEIIITHTAANRAKPYAHTSVLAKVYLLLSNHIKPYQPYKVLHFTDLHKR